MTSENATRPQVYSTELPRIRITPKMAKALKTVAAQQETGRHRPPVGVSEWVRDRLAQGLDEQLPGWDK